MVVMRDACIVSKLLGDVFAVLSRAAIDDARPILVLRVDLGRHVLDAACGRWDLNGRAPQQAAQKAVAALFLLG